MDGYKKWCEEQEMEYYHPRKEIKYDPSLSKCSDDELVNELKKRLNNGSFNPKEKSNINFTINYKSDQDGNHYSKSKSMYQFNTLLDGMLADKDEQLKEVIESFFNGDITSDEFEDSFEDSQKENQNENGCPVISWDPWHLS